MTEIKCPCGLRDYMEAEDCQKTDCAKCCPLRISKDVETAEQAAKPSNPPSEEDA